MQQFQEVYSSDGKSIIKINDMEYAKSLSNDDGIKHIIEHRFDEDFVYLIIDGDHEYLTFLQHCKNTTLKQPDFCGCGMYQSRNSSWFYFGACYPKWIIENMGLTKAQRVKLYAMVSCSIQYGFPVNDVVKEVIDQNPYILWHSDIEWTDDLITHIATATPEYMIAVPSFEERHMLIAIESILGLMKCGRLKTHRLMEFLESVKHAGKYMMRHFDTIKECVKIHPKYFSAFHYAPDITKDEMYELEKIGVGNDWSNIAYVNKQTPELVKIALGGSLAAWSLVNIKTKKLKEMAKKEFPELEIS